LVICGHKLLYFFPLSFFLHQAPVPEQATDLALQQMNEEGSRSVKYLFLFSVNGHMDVVSPEPVIDDVARADDCLRDHPPVEWFGWQTEPWYQDPDNPFIQTVLPWNGARGKARRRSGKIRSEE
jgi:hypothetical protein